jgi:hypothetical protein
VAAPLPFSRSEQRLLENLLKRKVRFKVLSLERILASKMAANRAKDKLSIPVLRDPLATMQSLKRRSRKRRIAPGRLSRS